MTKFDLQAGDTIVLQQYPFVVNEQLRFLPKRRCVVSGRWKNRDVIVKFFFSWRAEKHMRRELAGSKYLTLTKIKTPAVLGYGKTVKPGSHFVIYEQVLTNVDLEHEWISRQDEETLKKLLFAMQDIVSLQHQNGLFYTDPHPHNFIFTEGGVYLVDTTDVRCEHHRIALSVDKSLRNLAILYAQLAPAFESIVVEAFERYCLKRGWRVSDRLREKMLQLLYKQRQKRLKKFLCKTLNMSRYFIAKNRLMDRFAVRRDFYDTEVNQFLKKPEPFLSEAEVIKPGNTCTGFRRTLGGRDVVIKRYNVKDFKHFIRLNTRQSRAIRSWLYANAMSLFCLPTARANAFLEKRLWGIFQATSYFICDYLDGELLIHYLPKANDELLASISDQLIHFLIAFRSMRVVHGDLKATNFIVQEGKLYLIDLDGMKCCCSAKEFQIGFRDDLKRFLENWVDDLRIQNHFIKLFEAQQWEIA